MPLVMIWASDVVHPTVLDAIRMELPSIVAGALHVEGNPAGRLEVHDVSVRYFTSHMRDLNTTRIDILVLANDVPERRSNKTDRVRQMRGKIIEIRNRHGENNRTLPMSLWLRLSDGEYAEF